MDTNDVVMNSLLSKLIRTFTAPDTVNGIESFSKQSFFSFVAPGIPVTTSSLDFLAMANLQQLNAGSIFSQFVNSIPKPIGFWADTGAVIWNVYRDAVRNAIVPTNQLSPAEQQAFQAAQAVLFDQVNQVDWTTGAVKTIQVPTAMYASYGKYQQAYITASVAYNTKQIYVNTHPNDGAAVQDWALNAQNYALLVTGAYNDWVANGKGQIENAQATIGQLQDRGPSLYFQKLKNTLLLGDRTDGFGTEYFQTMYFPEQFWSSNSWSTFTFGEEEVHTYSSDSTTSWGGGTSGGWGFWSWGASVQHSESDHFDSCDTNGLQVSVDLIQIPLLRPWLDPLLFQSHAWRLPSGASDLSNGLAPPATAGSLPLIPTSMIVARNLKANLDMTTTRNSAHQSSTQVSGSVGWGPFSLRGGYSRVSSSNSHDYTSNGSGITCDGMQIIGFINAVVPPCPSPSGAALGDLMHVSQPKLLQPNFRLF